MSTIQSLLSIIRHGDTSIKFHIEMARNSVTERNDFNTCLELSQALRMAEYVSGYVEKSKLGNSIQIRSALESVVESLVFLNDVAITQGWKEKCNRLLNKKRPFESIQEDEIDMDVDKSIKRVFRSFN